MVVHENEQMVDGVLEDESWEEVEKFVLVSVSFQYVLGQDNPRTMKLIGRINGRKVVVIDSKHRMNLFPYTC